MANGDFSYEPELNYYGIDTFRYEICDDFILSRCDTALVTITIEPVNVAPSALDDTYITTEDVPVSEDLLINDEDSEGDNITISTTPLVLPMHGSLVINPDGTFTYTPDLGFIGNDSFTYEICDDGVPAPLCSEATVTIIVEPSLELVVFEGFSPNGDSMNDYWKIKGIERYPNNVVQVFNRWGNLVWEAQGYNNLDKAWRGQSNKGLFVNGGNELPDGTYFYRLDLGDGSKGKTSYIVLNR
jgi:gliding motility-associated-like protein